MIQFTAIIPTFNEEDNIEAAIRSVAFASEIIVLDSESTDRTIEIAKSLGCKIFFRPFDNYSSQKAYGLALASNDWVLMLDADERIPENLKNEILILLESDPGESAFYFKRKNFFMGKEIKFSGWQNDKVIRLLRKSKCRFNGKPVHEGIISEGKTGILKNQMEHYTCKNLNVYIRKIERYAELQASELTDSSKRITAFHLYLKPAFRFFRHYILLLGFRDGFEGFTIARIHSYGVFLRYAILKQMRASKNRQ
jgi:glycosyltransferase involved in cell wall biosynthesis